MFINNRVKFEAQRILKIKMLEELRDFPVDFVNIYFNENSDGILRGCEVSINEDVINIAKGIIIFNGMVFMLKENYKVEYKPDDKLNILKIKFVSESKNKDITSIIGEIFLDDNIKIEKDEMEIFRFKLKEGARLRNDYVNFEDLSTEYDTANIINVKYSAYKKHSISPEITRIFAKEMLSNKVTDPIDISFAITILKDKNIVDKELLINYIKYKLDDEVNVETNINIYNMLLRILKNIKKEKNVYSNKKYLNQTIIVDE